MTQQARQSRVLSRRVAERAEVRNRGRNRRIRVENRPQGDTDRRHDHDEQHCGASSPERTGIASAPAFAGCDVAALHGWLSVFGVGIALEWLAGTGAPAYARWHFVHLNAGSVFRCRSSKLSAPPSSTDAVT